ncbi:hypothetical protein [Pseudodesulfovibrio tunisiensis]|uniref:hypothetical protein n=1 Tax=Pseudodesulfovibrio tunisiensis TaxID=463192 RepID=UPI001FB2FD25|nr:hypothetical protein [Pseudodesulfovibrio tunisiensis]
MSRDRTDRYFWEKWNPLKQQRFFRLSLVGMALTMLGLFIALFLLTGSLAESIEKKKERYGAVAVIANEVNTLRARQGDLVDQPVDKAVWVVVDALDLDPNLMSLRPTTTEDGQKAFQAEFEALPLTRTVALLAGLRDRAGLQYPRCELTRNQSDPRLADLRLVLAR